MKFETVVTGSFQENCYIVWDEVTQKGIIVDPGDDADKIVARVRKLQLEIVGIYNTHGHFDHIGAVQPLKEKLNIPFAVHKGDEELISSAGTQGAMFGIHLPMESPEVETWLKDGMTVKVGNGTGKVLHTPGHTPGGVCFLFDEFVLVGDTLFAGSVGRTDLPGGNGSQLVASIQAKLMVLANDVQVLSGHGPVTTIGREKRYNPFIN